MNSSFYQLEVSLKFSQYFVPVRMLRSHIQIKKIAKCRRVVARCSIMKFLSIPFAPLQLIFCQSKYFENTLFDSNFTLSNINFQKIQHYPVRCQCNQIFFSSFFYMHISTIRCPCPRLGTSEGLSGIQNNLFSTLC